MKTTVETDAEKLRDSRYGWVICAMATLLLFCLGGLGSTGFGVYSPYLISISGLTNTQTSTVSMCRNLFCVLGTMVSGSLIDKLEVRNLITIALGICAAGFALFSFAGSFPVFCMAAALLGIAHGIGGYIPATILISRWFNEHRGLALGICMAATGGATIVGSPVITALIRRYSLTVSFRAESAFILVCAAIVYIFVRSLPGCLHVRPIGSHYHEVDVRKYAAHDASRKYYFLMMLGVFLFGIGANTITSHLSVLYASNDFGDENVAMLLSVYGLALAIGKCSYGGLADRIGTGNASLLLYVSSLIGCGLLCAAGNGKLWLAVLAMVTTAFGLAVTTVSCSLYSAGISTESRYAQTTSRFNALSMGGGLCFGMVPGIIADMTGSYIPAFQILFFITLAGVIILQLTYHRVRKLDSLYNISQKA